MRYVFIRSVEIADASAGAGGAAAGAGGRGALCDNVLQAYAINCFAHPVLRRDEINE